MLIRTDDEVYRVDSVWLGPPRATFPWRARYSSYGVGLIVMMGIMFVQRSVLNVDFGFFSVAWSLLLTIVITRFIGHRINDERPLSEWLSMFISELTGPRRRMDRRGGPLSAQHVRIRPSRPLPRRGRGQHAPDRRETNGAASAWGG